MKSETHLPSNPRKGLSYSLAATVLLSTNFVTAKYAMRGFDPWTFSLLWTSAAAVYAFIVVILSGQIREIILAKRHLAAMLWLGLATAVAMILAWAGLNLLNPSFAAFLFRFLPVLTIIFAMIFLSERPNLRLLAPAGLMVVGGCISTLGRWEVVGLGALLILLACCAAATQSLIAKIKVSQLHPNIVTFYRVFVGASILAIVVLGSGKAEFTHVQTKYWALMLLGALLGPCLAHLLMFRSYMYWELSRSSMVHTVQPLFVIPLAYLFFDKFPTGMELLGGIVIMMGAFWLMRIATFEDGPAMTSGGS